MYGLYHVYIGIPLFVFVWVNVVLRPGCGGLGVMHMPKIGHCHGSIMLLQQLLRPCTTSSSILHIRQSSLYGNKDYSSTYFNGIVTFKVTYR